jgi:hypothetical protein
MVVKKFKKKNKQNKQNKQNKPNMIFLFIGLLFIILHILICAFNLYVTFFSKNIKLLIIVLIITLYTLFQWIIIGYCIVSPIENYFIKEHIICDNYKDSIIFKYISKYTNVKTEIIVGSLYVGVVVVLIILMIKIYMFKNSNIIQSV